FVPSTELARQAGCACRWDGAAGGWSVVHDEWQRTSRAEIFAAGGVTRGARGGGGGGRRGGGGPPGPPAPPRRARHPPPPPGPAPHRRRALRALRARRRFSRAVQRHFAPRHDALAALADAETIVCRCEGVTKGELLAAVDEHPHLGTADAVKLLTRVGMGPCQGR